MTVINRFGPTVSEIEIELACSLPACSRTSEILFFYSTERYENRGFKIKELRYLLEREIVSGKIKKTDHIELPDEILEAMQEKPVMPKLCGNEAVKEEERYYRLYEQFLELRYKANPNSTEVELIESLYSTFVRLVPQSPLQELYRFFARDMFDYISDVLMSD